MKLRYAHFFSGIGAFGLGLFLAYMFSPQVVEFFKGALQPVLLVLGVLALLSVVFERTPYKKANLVAAVLLLGIGGYGLYDEYLAVKDVIFGALPIALVVFGLVSVFHGIKSLT